jgi:MoaA/NifB/PqqE/SkfB family radical SAM enzyme
MEIGFCVMVSVSLYDFAAVQHRDGKLLTFVVPGSCNLRCAVCIVRQRDEITSHSLEPADFATFIRQVAAKSPLFAISIQGHEPLMEESLPFTASILAEAAALKVPAGIVTNGILLPEAAPQLTDFSLSILGISLDSPFPNIHDSFRGISGAWSKTISGIKAALSTFEEGTSVVVTSILMPHDKGCLSHMPSLLKDLGVTQWKISLLQRISSSRRNLTGNAIDTFKSLRVIQNASEKLGISLAIDDELGLAERYFDPRMCRDYMEIEFKSVPRGVEIVRLAPGGGISMGLEIFSRINANTVRWRRELDAGAFIETISRLKRMSESEATRRI